MRLFRSVLDVFDVSLARAHKLRHQLQQTRGPGGIALVAIRRSKRKQGGDLASRCGLSNSRSSEVELVLAGGMCCALPSTSAHMASRTHRP